MRTQKTSNKPKISTRPFYQWKETDDGRYQAWFAVPGLVAEPVRENGKVRLFDTPHAAEFAALKAIYKILTARSVKTSKPDKVRRMTSGEFAAALSEADITATHFAELYGAQVARVLKWIDGVEDIPHAAHVFVRLMARQENYEEALQVTRRAQQQAKEAQNGSADA
ncbi:hypothetical protein [uncultured Nitratireductor sp.]|uniref:hypothetical protein n=1 Tax=uncultured Nitratireductor sp. TaxID=520953 RepID=UPI00260F9ED8|nr:hypothetical protein [uncultured Nitratireductor sp.]